MSGTQVSDKHIRSQVKDAMERTLVSLPHEIWTNRIIWFGIHTFYIFKKFEKEIFVFLIMAVIAFLAGPYYDEHRFGKYMMASMSAFAGILIYQNNFVINN